MNNRLFRGIKEKNFVDRLGRKMPEKGTESRIQFIHGYKSWSSARSPSESRPAKFRALRSARPWRKPGGSDGLAFTPHFVVWRPERRSPLTRDLLIDSYHAQLRGYNV